MLPVIPFGPLTLPTGPIFTLFGVILGLEVAGRYGKRLGLSPDALWNTGLFALLSGLIVARLWNVIQFWDIYLTDPWLVFSLRPGGFVLAPGVVAAFVVGYLYLIRTAMDPLRVATAFTIGAVAAGILFSIGDFLTGARLGTLSNLPWTLSYYDELRHPVAIYQAVGLFSLLIALWLRNTTGRLGQTILLAALGYSLLRLFLDAFVDETALWGAFRVSQVLAFIAALGLTLLLARSNRADRQQ